MTLRVKLAIEKQWKSVSFRVASPHYSLKEAPNEHVQIKFLINEIVGDFQRVLEYPKLGFQNEIDIPNQIMESFKFLLNARFNLHLINS